MNIQRPATALMREHYLDFFEPSYPRRLLRMIRDLRRPRSSPEYRIAALDLRRLATELLAVLATLLILGLALLTGGDGVPDVPYFDIQWTADTAPKPPAPDQEEPPKPEPQAEDTARLDTAAFDAAAVAAFQSALDVTAAPAAAIPAAAPQAPSLQAAADAVAPIKSIVQLKQLSGESRGAGVRTALIAQGGGSRITEETVVRALRWLKKNQQADGSWKSQKVAMTGLALLTFLAHDERPAYSPEFGAAVQKGLEFLLASQRPDGRFNGMDGNEYAHPIATYALCEAYGMTLNPNVKAAAEKALVPIIKGQHPTGGWTYRMDPAMSKEDGKYRDDTSYMGWCAQALKAAKLARLNVDGLDKALKLTVKGFQKNAHPNGGFGYTAPGQGGLTSVGTLCLQLLGAAGEPEVKKSLALMESWRPTFDAENPVGGSAQYACYYATQAKFHAGGKPWEAWNREMLSLYLKTQLVEKGAAKDDQGRDADIGWWVNRDAHTDRPVMDTCLAALQLMVYYRNLPTTSAAAIKHAEETVASAADKEDIAVHTGNL